MVEKLMEEAKKYFTAEEIRLIKKAYMFANDLHKGQMRKSGEPYIIHPVEVAYILLTEMNLKDANSICAALLHDTIEDTGITKEYLEKHFNKDIANLVAGVSKIKDLNFASKTEEEQYNTCVLLRSLMRDFRVILIKLADRTHNMRTMIYKGDANEIEKYRGANCTIEELPLKANKKQIEKCSETLTLFVPLANYVGEKAIEKELADISLMYLNNKRFRKIRKNLQGFIDSSSRSLEKTLEEVKRILEEYQIPSEIRMRSKNIYDTNGLLKKYHKLENIPGLLSFEIVVDDFKDCYLALAYLSRVFHPENQSLIDYIAVPKPNGYHAIHTILSCTDGLSIEFKICSKSMRLLNHYGLAVLNQIYPEKTMEEIKSDLSRNNKFIKALESIDSLYEKDDEFLRQINIEILKEQIKVFSKDGEAYYLPKGATVLDFAYKIHTEIGDEAVGAIVNGIDTDLNYSLKDHDVVNIVVARGKMIQDECYLDTVVTAKAKKKIKEGQAKLARILKLSESVPNFRQK